MYFFPKKHIVLLHKLISLVVNKFVFSRLTHQKINIYILFFNEKVLKTTTYILKLKFYKKQITLNDYISNNRLPLSSVKYLL